MRKLLTILATALCLSTMAQRISLSGEWQFSTGDRPHYSDHIKLPGSMLTNGKGNKVNINTPWVSSLYDSSYYFNPYMKKYHVEENIKFPFFLTPATHYVGNAWYKKTVDIPSSWKKHRITLFIERPHIETSVFVNGKAAGRDSSLSVPHEFDITPLILAGRKNTIEVKIYNGIENVCVGQDSHSVTDQTQGNWNGMTGRIELICRPMTCIADLQVFPSVSDMTAGIAIKLNGKQGKHTLNIICTDTEGRDSKAITKSLRFKGDTIRTTIAMGSDARLWDEFSPNLYRLTAILDGKDTVSTVFGMREIGIKGRQFLVNGRETWMRGTVENCCFPLTGYPPTDEESWLKIFRKCKEYGLNHMRFHSYCPPEAAFAAADKVGFYLQPEGPSWPNHGVKLGKGMTIDRYLLEETQHMVKTYGNHPSFCMLAAGNEPAGDWVKWVGDFVDYWKSTGDKRRVYCGASVGGGWAFDPKSEYHVKGGARGLDWNRHAPQSMDDFYPQITSFLQKGRQPITFEINEPLIAHEQGQWCAFPDLNETSQYTGAYKARNFEIFADLLKDNNMAPQAQKFLMASGKLQTLAYKYEMERNLRTPEYAGFQLLGLNDYSGQGTALVGVLNVFWREKGYCTAKDWQEFCAPIVPLARFPKFVYTSADTLSVPIELYNAYKEPLDNANTLWQITSEGRTVAKAETSQGIIPLGKNHSLGTAMMNLATVDKPAKFTLSVTVSSTNAAPATNHWDFWVYPKHIDMPSAKDIHITDTLDNRALKVLERGGSVLIEAAGKVRYGSDVKQTYLPVFWNTSWFKMRPPHTTGATIATDHPLFRHFPTDNWTNLNWWELVNKAQVMNLSRFPASYNSPIQPVDTWHISRKLGMLIEARMLNGKVLMTTIDISSDLDRRPVARQMRKAILDYMLSDSFAPQMTLSPALITSLFETEAPPVNMFTKGTPDELKPKLK